MVRILCALKLESRKNYQTGLDAGNLEFQVLRPREVSPNHLEICRFVSGSWSKHQVSSPVIVLLNFCLHCDNILARCDSIFPLLRCQELWNKCTHHSLFLKSSFRIRRSTALRIFKDSATIIDGIRWSFLAKWATAAMFTSGRLDLWRPPISSFSIRSLASRNRE